MSPHPVRLHRAATFSAAALRPAPPQRRPRSAAPLLLLLLGVALSAPACDDRTYAPSPSSQDAGADAPPDGDATTGDAAAGDAATGDPSHTRVCQRGDFICDDLSCEIGQDAPLRFRECYLRCDTDADCDEPQRPFCVQVGLFDGGDYQCNDTAQLCLSERLHEPCR